MFQQSATLRDGSEITWQQSCFVETADSPNMLGCTLAIIQNQGQFGLIQIFVEDDPDNNLPLLPCTYDVLFQLYHPWNQSYFVGYKNGKCALLRVSAHAFDMDGDAVTVCRALCDPEYDSIAWYGENVIVLHQGEARREYCLQTHTMSERYEYIW